MNKKVSLEQIGVIITLILALVAELYRFHGYLLLDLWLPIFTFSLLAYRLLKKDLKIPKNISFFAIAFYISGLGALLINSGQMSFSEFLGSAFYGIRFLSGFFLFLLVCNDSKNKNFYIVSLSFFAISLSVAGFIQLKYVPDFTPFQELGWDPHQNRLLSTWFDPNFVGGFLAFLTPILIAAFLEKNSWRIYLGPALFIIVLAIFLTYSRSAYLALVFGILIFGLFHSRILLISAAIIAALSVGFSDKAQERVSGLIIGIESVFTENYQFPDPSSRLRFQSWENGIELFLEKSFFGQGYNRYKYAAFESGKETDLKGHSASGSDSSIITVLATTGIFGGIFFLLFYLSLIAQSLKNKDLISFGFFSGLLGLLLHSVFVNSLLFPLLMAPFFIAAGVLYKPKSSSPR